VPSIAIVLLAVLALAVRTEAAWASTTHDRWRRPMAGAAVVRAFSFDPAAPYVRGRRRGIDLRARPGSPVLAACAGTVAHAGRVPGWGPGVTLRCGALVATELGLADGLRVRRGARVRAGAPVGRLGASGVLRLGARRAGARQGYLDPLPLLDDGAPAPVAPPAVARPPARAPRQPRRPGPTAARRAPVRIPAGDRARAHLPWPIWAGLGLLAAGAGGGTVARRRRGQRSATGAALAHRYR
jgi:murein DD-endopeptidase MepM/ murein hydrolase activator NlpD